jgi:outer membrane lipoprotein-sorting protein
MKLTKIISAALMALVLATPAMAQDDAHDPNAKKILDKVQSTTQSYQTLRASFDWTLENKAEKTKDTKSGFMFLKGGKYKLILAGTEMFSDGTTMWTYSKEANEITISEVEEDEDNIISNPTKIFDLYQKGFKYALKGEEQRDVKVKKDGKVVTEKKTCQIVDLYPENPRGKEFHTVELVIVKETAQIAIIDIKFKNGSAYQTLCVEIDGVVCLTVNLSPHILEFFSCKFLFIEMSLTDLTGILRLDGFRIEDGIKALHYIFFHVVVVTEVKYTLFLVFVVLRSQLALFGDIAFHA